MEEEEAAGAEDPPTAATPVNTTTDVADAETAFSDPVPESELTIDEGKSVRKAPAKRGTKRRAEESPAVAATPPPAKQARGAAANAAATATPTSAQPDAAASEKISRSGRVIKPKKFDDEIVQEKVR